MDGPMNARGIGGVEGGVGVVDARGAGRGEEIPAGAGVTDEVRLAARPVRGHAGPGAAPRVDGGGCGRGGRVGRGCEWVVALAAGDNGGVCARGPNASLHWGAHLRREQRTRG